jgi:mannonate dehydratase
MTRRTCLTGIAALSAAAESAEGQGRTPVRKEHMKRGIQLAELFTPDEDHKIRLARQIGITHGIVTTTRVLGPVPRGRYLDELAKVQKQFANAGLIFAGTESHPVSAEKIKLGIDGRDEEIENYIAAIRALAELGVRLVCYNWMAGIGWFRTRTDLPGRGGALISEFNRADAEKLGLTEWGRVSEERIWSNLEYFLKAVIPVAEKAGVNMALHPDDPPLSPLRGIGRILTSAANYRRVLGIVPSPVNGITFCQANFKLMGEDIAALVREWCGQKKIFFVHYRDVEGTREHFRECFHDDSPVDLAAMLKIYHDAGFEGPIRPDHAPTLDGESNDKPGYAMGGKVLAIGYMKGAMDAMGIPYWS